MSRGYNSSYTALGGGRKDYKKLSRKASTKKKKLKGRKRKRNGARNVCRLWEGGQKGKKMNRGQPFVGCSKCSSQYRFGGVKKSSPSSMGTSEVWGEERREGEKRHKIAKKSQGGGKPMSFGSPWEGRGCWGTFRKSISLGYRRSAAGGGRRRYRTDLRECGH